MELTTNYLGLKLNNPVIVSSSSLTGSVENIIKCAQAGAGAVVLKSIFEEQIMAEIHRENANSNTMSEYPEAQEYLQQFFAGNEIEAYTELISKAKKAVNIPIIASINCDTQGEWVKIAQKFEKAGADALELNIAIFPFDAKASSESIENEYVNILKSVKAGTKLPIAVKLGNQFTNVLNIAQRLIEAGANALTLFNKFYTPDIDIENPSLIKGSSMSSADEGNATMRWICIMRKSGFECNISASTGIHTGKDAVKQLLAGATTVQVCSTVYQNGFEYIGTITKEISAWMTKKNYSRISDFRGLVGNNAQNSNLLERIQYIKRNAE